MISSDIAQYYGYFMERMVANPPSLSFVTKDWSDIEAWRSEAKAKVHELMNFAPEDVPFNAAVDSSWEEDGIVYEKVSYDQPYGPRTEGCVMAPKSRSGERLPAVIAFHDHGAFKYFGWQKITAIPDESMILTSFKERCYEGRSWATELARRGYVVLVLDAFPFGSRRLDPMWLTGEILQRYSQLGVNTLPLVRGDDGSNEYIEAYNGLTWLHESDMAKSLFVAGTTWPGVWCFEDMRSVDYALTRPEVDPDRIGCAGLSGGGMRTDFVGGLDERIRCAIVVGFMTTHAEMLRSHVKCHTWMYYVPRLSNYLDMPDLAALRVPKPLMVQYDIEDPLYTLKGQKDADAKMAAIYEKADKPENYQGRFYPGDHKFDIEMQEDAFDWFDKWLK